MDAKKRGHLCYGQGGQGSLEGDVLTHYIDPHLESRFFWRENELCLFLHNLLVAMTTDNPPTTVNNKRNIGYPTVNIIIK